MFHSFILKLNIQHSSQTYVTPFSSRLQTILSFIFNIISDKNKLAKKLCCRKHIRESQRIVWPQKVKITFKRGIWKAIIEIGYLRSLSFTIISVLRSTMAIICTNHTQWYCYVYYIFFHYINLDLKKKNSVDFDKCYVK